MAKVGKRLKGRHMLKMVYEHHRLDETQHAVYNFENILAVTLKGDKLQKSPWRDRAPPDPKGY